MAPVELQYMNKAYLLIGGNMGNRLQNLGRSVQLLQQYGEIVKLSDHYETAAWGKTDQPAFLNQALLLHTPLSARALLQTILQIEEQLGRKREEKYGPRIIDMDILFFNNDIIDEPGLKVPHPEIPNRRFVLAPMQEIAGSLVHPILGKTIATLLLETNDTLEVRKLHG